MIAQAIDQIKGAGHLSGLDESATKQGVVLRLLSLAGWDTFDISRVVPEYTVGNRRVDYALRPDSPNAVFIEVKRPSENLEPHQQQLLEYCFEEGVKLAVLTNGRTWWFYLPLQAGNWEKRRFLTIDLESQKPETVENRFLEFLSPESVDSGQAVNNAEDLVESQQRAEIISQTIAEAWKQIIETPDDLLVDLISETTERICGFKPDAELVEQFLARRIQTQLDSTPFREEPAHRPPITPAPTNAADTTTIVQPQKIDGKKSRPATFVFLDNQAKVNSWNDILIQMCGLISQLQPQAFNKVLELRRSQRPGARWPYFFSRSSDDLRKSKSIPNSDLFVEVDLRATTIVELCYRLVHLFGYPQSSLTIEVR